MTMVQEIIRRLEHYGYTSPGGFNLAADILELAAHESDNRTNRADDAMRIPDMIGDTARMLREMAQAHIDRILG